MTAVDISQLEMLVVTTDTLRKTQAFLRKRGRAGAEALALWAGRRIDSVTFGVTRPVFPEQVGTLVTVNVESSEIERVDDECRARGEVIGAQLHTHPTRAFHSDTDDATPVINKIGAVSIVVPNFANASITDLSRAVVVQLVASGWSSEWSLDRRSQLLRQKP